MSEARWDAVATPVGPGYGWLPAEQSAFACTWLACLCTKLDPAALRSLCRCRLRAALNSTQGFGTEPYFLPGGATPASLASGGRGGGAAGGVATRGRRASSLLRRDSESGAASEK